MRTPAGAGCSRAAARTLLPLLHRRSICHSIRPVLTARPTVKRTTMVARSSRRPRPRRTAEEAHRQILEATERRLIEGGPEAVRLADIAADVGISHPAILHHFGSRERLLEALARHAIAGLQRDLVQVIGTRKSGDPPERRVARALRAFERTFQTFAGRGYARLLAGLVLNGRDLGPQMKGILGELARAAHATRVERRREDRRPPPEWDDTLFGVSMVLISLFGDALVGRLIRLSVGLPEDAATGRRFRHWMASMLELYQPHRVAEPGAIAYRRRPLPRRNAGSSATTHLNRRRRKLTRGAG